MAGMEVKNYQAVYASPPKNAGQWKSAIAALPRYAAHNRKSAMGTLEVPINVGCKRR